MGLFPEIRESSGRCSSSSMQSSISTCRTATNDSIRLIFDSANSLSPSHLSAPPCGFSATTIYTCSWSTPQNNPTYSPPRHSPSLLTVHHQSSKNFYSSHEDCLSCSLSLLFLTTNQFGNVIFYVRLIVDECSDFYLNSSSSMTCLHGALNQLLTKYAFIMNPLSKMLFSCWLSC